MFFALFCITWRKFRARRSLRVTPLSSMLMLPIQNEELCHESFHCRRTHFRSNLQQVKTTKIKAISFFFCKILHLFLLPLLGNHFSLLICMGWDGVAFLFLFSSCFPSYRPKLLSWATSRRFQKSRTQCISSPSCTMSALWWWKSSRTALIFIQRSGPSLGQLRYVYRVNM